MESEIIKTLGDLSAIILAGIVLVYVARTMFSRSKSDTETIRTIADILSGAFNDVRDGVQTHGAESETRHTELLGAIRALVDSVSLRDARMISSINDLSANVGAHIQKVDEVGGNIMDKVKPLDQTLRDIHTELKSLRQSVDTYLGDSVKFRDDVIIKTTAMEARLVQVEKRATQETPVVPAKLEAVPKSTEAKAKKEKTE